MNGVPLADSTIVLKLEFASSGVSAMVMLW